MKTVLLFLKLMFSLRKNLFFERFAFVKSQSPRKNAVYYGIWFVLKEVVFPAVGLILLVGVLKKKALAFCLICVLLFFKLFQIDNYDWKLFFRDDFRLAYPKNNKRYGAVLTGNLLKGLFLEDITPIYLIALIYCAELSVTLALILYALYLAIYALTLNYYFLLQTSGLRAKRFYALFSYGSSMMISFGITYGMMSLLIRFVRHNDVASLREGTPQLFYQMLSAGESFLNRVYEFVLQVDRNIWLSICAGAFLLLLASFAAAWYRSERYEAPERSDQKLPELPGAADGAAPRTVLEGALLWKERRLFSHLYQYQFRAYWFTVLFDRPLAFMLGFWASLYHYGVQSGGYILFLLGLFLFPVEISSQVNVKLSTNLSFVADYNTLRLANTNGVPLEQLIKTKLRLFYRVRLVPELVTLLILLVCQAAAGLPLLLLPIFGGVCLYQLWLYPSVYLTNNLINTRMDYRDYEKYLEESKLIDTGAEDFFPLKISGNARGFLAFGGIIAGFLLNYTIWIYLGIAAIFIGIGTFEHCMMKRILCNIIDFIQRGDYSADVKKIFNQSGRKT